MNKIIWKLDYKCIAANLISCRVVAANIGDSDFSRIIAMSPI